MMDKKVIFTENASKPIGPYSQGIISGDLLFLSGERGIDPKTGKIVEGGIQKQTEQMFNNIKAVLEKGGASLDKVVKATVFLTDLNEFDLMNEVYKTFFKEKPPVRTSVEVSRLPGDVKIEVDVIAVL
jgi:2-iminobutanoate/2-iminopropanoate deaminase